MFSKLQYQGYIGKGEFGEVYKATHVFAVKRLKTFTDEWKGLIREIETQRESSNHRNIVKVFDAYEDGGRITIVLEYCDLGNLNDYMIMKRPDLTATFTLMRHMAEGLSHLHRNGIAHRDIKPDNVMISSGEEGPVCKLGDFGLSTWTDQGLLRTRCGTSLYGAPEVMYGSYTKACDVFSLGVVYFAIITMPLDTDKEGKLNLWPTVGDRVFSQASANGVRERVMSTITEKWFCKTVLSMLDFHRSSRIRADELCEDFSMVDIFLCR